MLHFLTHGHMAFQRTGFGRFDCCYVRFPLRFLLHKKNRLKLWLVVEGQEAFVHDVTDLTHDANTLDAVAHADTPTTAMRIITEYRKNRELTFNT